MHPADIAGRWYEADHPLSDGNGNPPPGWGNPDQPGTVTMLSATTAEFRDSLGHVVRFHLLARGIGPKHICALRQFSYSERTVVHAPAPGISGPVVRLSPTSERVLRQGRAERSHPA